VIPIWLFASSENSNNSLENRPNYKSAGSKNTSSHASHHSLAFALL
jgi:hypothetical protein